MGCTVSRPGRDSVNVSIRESLVSIAPPATQSSASSVGSQQAERASSSSPRAEMTYCLSIVHFNDVYEVQERKREPVGGVARFKTAVDRVRDKNPLVVFSGDCLNPSPCKYR